MAFYASGFLGDLTYLSFKAPQNAAHVSFIMPDTKRLLTDSLRMPNSKRSAGDISFPNFVSFFVMAEPITA